MNKFFIYLIFQFVLFACGCQVTINTKEVSWTDFKVLSKPTKVVNKFVIKDDVIEVITSSGSISTLEVVAKVDDDQYLCIDEYESCIIYIKEDIIRLLYPEIVFIFKINK